MQDYNYVWADCFEITLELSCCKYPMASQLQQEWEYNRESLLTFIEKVKRALSSQEVKQGLVHQRYKA